MKQVLIKDNYYIKQISKDTAKQMIIKNHYSHQCSQTTICLGLFEKGNDSIFFENETDDILLGCCIYNTPVGRDVWASISTTLQMGEVFELTRLWVKDGTPKNTESWFIAQSFDWLRKNRPDIKCLISYADPGVGHRGVIYQATNWLYQPSTNGNGSSGLYSYSFDNCKTWIHAKTMSDKYGVGTLNLLKPILRKPFWIKPATLKNRYIYPLCNKKERNLFMKNLKHPILPYPKSIEKINTEIICINA